MAAGMERYFSVDVLADILRRLPPSARRRARLVCRHWRDVVNKRTTEMRSRAKPLIWDDGGVAYVVDDLSSAGSCRELWRTTISVVANWRGDRRTCHLVGACNGLLCVCDNEERTGGSLTVSNPVTGETLPVPPLRCAGLFVGGHRGGLRWDKAYNFAYHPVTGKYKVVHVPWSRDRLFDFQTVQVLTMGETTWREVPAPAGGARCHVSAGVITVDGVTHWVKVGGSTRIVSFDLDTECFISATPLPRLPDSQHSSYHLTEVHGRLGFVILPEVWVLEKGQRWSRRYKLEEGVPRPHFIYGDYILMWIYSYIQKSMDNSGFYAHRHSTPPPSGWRLECDGIKRVGHRDNGTVVARLKGNSERYRTFAYIETIEPLSVYAKN